MISGRCRHTVAGPDMLCGVAGDGRLRPKGRRGTSGPQTARPAAPPLGTPRPVTRAGRRPQGMADAEARAGERRPGAAILPCVLGGRRARRHMLPFGEKDRPTFAAASQARAKEVSGLVLLGLPGDGLRPGLDYGRQGRTLTSSRLWECSRRGSYTEPSRNT